MEVMYLIYIYTSNYVFRRLRQTWSSLSVCTPPSARRGSSYSLRGDSKTTPSFLTAPTQVIFLTVMFQVVEANLEFTGRPSTAVRKEGVVFLTQRRQATSDYKENTKVKPNGDVEDR